MKDLDPEKLYGVLEAFYVSTGVPITLLSEANIVVRRFGDDEMLCALFDTIGMAPECRDTISFSADFSFQMGEPYVFACPLGMIHIAVAILYDGKYRGCALAGPLIASSLYEQMLEKIYELYPSSGAMLPRISLLLSQMPVCAPNRIQHLATLLYHSITSCSGNMHEYEQINSRNRMQASVSSSIARYKENPSVESYTTSYDRLLKLLMIYVRTRNIAEAKSVVDLIMSELALTEGGNFQTIRTCVWEIFSELTLSASESGCSIPKIFADNSRDVMNLPTITTMDELTAWLTRVVAYFAEKAFGAMASIRSPIISKAVECIDSRYMEQLTLRDLASELFINESYLSKLFRKELGRRFTDYLNETRINRSIELMQDTDMNLLEIAGRVGFDDPSYFTKTFKKVMGETPKQFRSKGILGAIHEKGERG